MITNAMMADPVLRERLARRWCELMGVNPEELVGHGVETDPATGYRPDVFLRSPRWVVVAREVSAQLAWLKAISEVA